jgi:hypothetical protein
MGAVLAGLAVAALGGMATAPPGVRRGYTPRPPGAEPSTLNVGDNAFRLFLDPGFGGSSHLKRPVTEAKPHRLYRPGSHMKDGMSSLCWNLPEGVVLAFYDHSNARGRQYITWGSGAVDDLAPWQFGDKLSRWAWFYVGGVDYPSKEVLRGRALRPLGTRPTRAPVAEDGMFLYAASAFNGLRQKVSDVTALPPGELQPIAAPDGPLEELHSLQWNLPHGVIVVLYEHPDLTGRQFAVWGKGELRATRHWGSDGSIAGWAWFYVGTPETLATPEP